jgi:hypothetical protein
MNGTQGLAGWRLIFILEGVVCRVLAIANQNSRMLTDSLDHLCYWLCRLRADRGLSGQSTPLMAIPQ